jgi:hypothetical protein
METEASVEEDQPLRMILATYETCMNISMREEAASAGGLFVSAICSEILASFHSRGHGAA